MTQSAESEVRRIGEAPMSNTTSLRPDEARCLRRRWAVALGAVVAVGVVDVAAMVELGHEGRFAWIAGCVPGVLLCLVLHSWAARCPRCRGSVLGSGDGEEWKRYPDDSGWVFI